MSQKTIERIYKKILKIKKKYSWLGFTDSKAMLLTQALYDAGLRFRVVDKKKVLKKLLNFWDKEVSREHKLALQYYQLPDLAHAIAIELNKEKK